MEFFRLVEVLASEEMIQTTLSLENLEKMSGQLFLLGPIHERKAAIGSIWGEFTLTRDPIRGGLRFALEECPNALVWTVTTGFSPAKHAIVIHLTINRTKKQHEFIEEIEDFLNDQVVCLEQLFKAGL